MELPRFFFLKCASGSFDRLPMETATRPFRRTYSLPAGSRRRRRGSAPRKCILLSIRRLSAGAIALRTGLATVQACVCPNGRLVREPVITDLRSRSWTVPLQSRQSQPYRRHKCTALPESCVSSGQLSLKAECFTAVRATSAAPLFVIGKSAKRLLRPRTAKIRTASKPS